MNEMRQRSMGRGDSVIADQTRAARPMLEHEYALMEGLKLGPVTSRSSAAATKFRRRHDFENIRRGAGRRSIDRMIGKEF